MRRLIYTSLIVFYSFLSFSQSFNTAKPWAYWWWPGSAVNEADIATNLKTYTDAGFGGLHIIPIYGVKGEENKFIPYMSDQWLSILDFTVKEAAKNGLGIDMTLGTGWPFGGADVKTNDGAKKFELTNTNGKWSLQIKPTGQKVKRAAPGGEGLVVDHFDKTAITNYLNLFDNAFSKNNYAVRAFYNDSYEVYEANWTTDFFNKFKQLRGYDLNDHLDVLSLTTANTEREKRIWADYHQTLHDLLVNEFTKVWTGFSSKYGKLSRNEAHGSPSNILDLYGLSDIPETEFFGSKAYDIPLYRQDPDYDPARFGTPTEYVMKLASSPAHLLGKKRVSSETATWNANHFKGALSQIKPLVDESFVAGVNHIFYHGVPYTPPSAVWPGWLFYASTNFNQNSHFFDQLPLLNRYIEVCQTRLQNSIADNDVLILLPFSDLWHSVGNKSKMHTVEVHNITNGGIFSKELLSLLDKLTRSGIGYDFISDDQVINLEINNKKLKSKKSASAYKALLIPTSEYMKNQTALGLKKIAKAGVPVLFEKKAPTKSYGYLNWQSNDKLLSKTLSKLKKYVTNDIVQSLAVKGIIGESLGSKNIRFIRKINKAGKKEYFITNLSANSLLSPISLNISSKSITVFDPLTENTGFVLQDAEGNYLIPLKPGQSLFLTEGKQTDLLWQPGIHSKSIDISGEWNIQFTQGEPSKPSSFTTKELLSWTQQADARYFDGYADHTIKFTLADIPAHKSILDLGDIRESALVTINGQKMGTAWSLPFELIIPAGILKQENELTISVRNSSANRIKKLDEESVIWKKFYDINFVDITYTPFDATKWPLQPSGLLGPVVLRY